MVEQRFKIVKNREQHCFYVYGTDASTRYTFKNTGQRLKRNLKFEHIQNRDFYLYSGMKKRFLFLLG